MKDKNLKSDNKHNHNDESHEETVIINRNQKKNFEMYLSFQPLVGLAISIFLGLFFLMLRTKWSTSLLLYLLFPLLILTIIYFSLYIPLHKHLDLKPIYFKGIWRFITIGMLTLLIAIIILLYCFSPRLTHENLNLSQLEQKLLYDKQHATDESYYVVFGSENCYFCFQMEQIYAESFENSNISTINYCDLTFESPFDDRIIDLGIAVSHAL